MYNIINGQMDQNKTKSFLNADAYKGKKFKSKTTYNYILFIIINSLILSYYRVK